MVNFVPLNPSGQSRLNDPRLGLAKALLSGNDRPVRTPTGALSQIGEKLIGAFLAKGALDDQKQAATTRNQAFARALGVAQGTGGDVPPGPGGVSSGQPAVQAAVDPARRRSMVMAQLLGSGVPASEAIALGKALVPDQKERRIEEDIGGRKRFVDTQKPVFPNAQKPIPEPKTGVDVPFPSAVEAQKRRLAIAGRSRQNINISDQRLSKPLQTASVKALDKADTLASLEAELQATVGAASQSDTGFTTPITLPVKALFKDLGINLDALGIKDNVSILQVFQAQQNRLALRLRNPQSGLGLTGNTSDRDVKFLKQSVAGIEKTSEANEIILLTMLGRTRRERVLAEFRSDYIETNKTLGGFSKAKRKLINETDFFTPEEEARINELHAAGIAKAQPLDIRALSDETLKKNLGIK